MNIAGVSLTKGDLVYLDVLNANKDPEVFESPGEVRITRTPNPHLTFGLGTHFCFGAPMARMQIESFLSAFVQKSKTTSFELLEGASKTKPSAFSLEKIRIRSKSTL
jgi:cytochrome P450